MPWPALTTRWRDNLQPDHAGSENRKATEGYNTIAPTTISSKHGHGQQQHGRSQLISIRTCSPLYARGTMPRYSGHEHIPSGQATSERPQHTKPSNSKLAEKCRKAYMGTDKSTIEQTSPTNHCV